MKYTVQLEADLTNVTGKLVYLYDTAVGTITEYNSETGISFIEIEDIYAKEFEELFFSRLQGVSSRSQGVSSNQRVKNIVVIGEKCTDVFMYGNVTRINPEAPSPVFVTSYAEERKGMAHNVHANLESMINAKGNPINATFFSQNNLIRKTRYVEEQHNYILLRVDEETSIDQIHLDEKLMTEVKNADIVVVSDYNKGYLSTKDLMTISQNAKCTFLDTKKPLDTWASDFTWIKINMSEYKNPAHNTSFLEEADNIIVTHGKHGAILNGKKYETSSAEIMDVSGAGDTFLAGLAYAWAISSDIDKSIFFANEMATASVQRKGVINDIAADLGTKFDDLIDLHL